MELARKRRAGNQAGFSLLELMIAVVLLAIGVLSAFYGQVSSLNLLRAARERNTIMSDLEACMETILSEPLTDIPGEFPPGVSVPAFDGLNLDSQQLVPTYPGFAGGPVPEPLEILLTATWDDWRGRPQAIRLASVRTR